MASATFQPSSKEERKAADALDRAKEAGTEAIDKAREAGAQALGKAREAAESVGEAASQTVSAVGKKADDMTAACGHEIREFGETIGKKTPREGIAGHASQVVADTIKGGGQYIEDAKLSGMAHDVENVIKSHPFPALLVCLGIGFCIGRALKD